MSFQFPYQYGFIDNRKIPYPVVPVQLSTIRGLRTYSFIMDTGADTMTLPHYMITLLGIQKNTLAKGVMQGIGSNRVAVWETTIEIFFCKKTLALRCSFTDNDTTPFLLGKEGIFDRYTVTFDNDRNMTVFEEKRRIHL